MGISLLDMVGGMELINNIPSGNEKQLYNVGQKVCSTELSPVCCCDREIIGLYKENGYFYYLVNMGDYTRIFRQKDIIPTKE